MPQDALIDVFGQFIAQREASMESARHAKRAVTLLALSVGTPEDGCTCLSCLERQLEEKLGKPIQEALDEFTTSQKAKHQAARSAFVGKMMGQMFGERS